jgi:hypothetical protein
VRGKIAEDFVACPVAERGHSSLDVGRPCFVVWLGNPGHRTILIEGRAKSKSRSLDDTLSIFDNSFHSLFVVVVGRFLTATPEAPDLVHAPASLDYLLEAVKTMRVETRADQAQNDQATKIYVDVSLRRAPEPAALAIPVDQIMIAVDSVRGYVISHLARIGRASDADDVMQDIRVAVWDGVTRGRYRRLPGVPFAAWVQGVCCNVCAAYVRRELSHQTLPLLMEPDCVDGSASVDAAAFLGFDRIGDRNAEKVVDQDWARTIIELTRSSVPPGVWELAVGSLTGPRQYGLPSNQDRRRWRAVTVVRQTARTVQHALEVEQTAVCNISDVCQQAAACLPTPVLRRTAATIVRPGLRGPERARALAALATELGVTERYVAVQIGFARRLYQASWRIIRAGMQGAR